MLRKDEINLYKKNGYLVIKDYLKKIYFNYNEIDVKINNKNYIDIYRKLIIESYTNNKFPKSNLNFIEFFNNKIISKILNSLYPNEEYYSSGLHKCFSSKYKNTQNNKCQWHRDTYKTKKNKELDKNLKIIKAIIYFQNHTEFSDTLKVLPGSHIDFYKKIIKKYIKINNKNFLIEENAKNIDINKGDLILFDIRLLHSGHSYIIKNHSEYVIESHFQNTNFENIKNYILPKSNIDRILCQNEFIIGNDHLNNFIYRFDIEKNLYYDLYNNTKLNFKYLKSLEKKTNIKMINLIYNYATDLNLGQ